MTRLLIMGDARSVHIERWGRYFSEQGFEVALFSLEPKSIFWPGPFFKGKRRTGIGLIDSFLAQKDYFRALDDFRPDIVNAHYVISYGWLASFGRCCPVVTTAWGSDLLILPEKSFLHRLRIARALRSADCCTVDSINLHRAAARFIPADKIIRIVMGVDRALVDSFSGARDDVINKGPLRIIAPRGFKSVYDPDCIIRAAELLRGKIDFQIDLLGEGPETETIEAKIAAGSLSESVIVRPFLPHDQFASSLKNYDIYLSASLSDSTSVALLEAMAAGLFPVVSDIDGNREWIDHEINGVTFEPGKAEALAEAVKRAAAMREKFGAVAEKNREKVKGEAVWQDNLDRIKKVFLELSGHE